MIQLTNNGVKVQTFEEVYNELVAKYKAIYGNDINVEPNTPDGQRIGIQARQIIDMQMFLLSSYNQLDPNVAEGVALEKLVKFTGLTRLPASKSQSDLIVTASRAVTISSGFKVEDEIGQVFETITDYSLNIGSNNITVFATEFGAIESPAGTINKPATIVLGVDSVTNTFDATVGTDEETDEELRIRRSLSLESPATSTVGGIFSALGNLPNVTDLAVYENATDFFDDELALKAHSIWVVIEGGDIQAIVNTIVKNKTGGTGLKGDNSGEFVEVITVGSLTFNKVTTIEFDRPTVTQAFVKVDIEAKNGAAVNVESIKNAISSGRYIIGEELVASRLYNTIYNSQDNIIATNLQISTNNADFVGTIIEASPQEKFSILPENILINII